MEHRVHEPSGNPSQPSLDCLPGAGVGLWRGHQDNGQDAGKGRESDLASFCRRGTTVAAGERPATERVERVEDMRLPPREVGFRPDPRSQSLA